MRSILHNIITNDASYNKSATRYLYKTHPDLWEQILASTGFLPETAKPKQRIWHVLNDTYKIPLCPETGVEVKWHENRYLEYATIAAGRKGAAKKISKSTRGAGHWRSKDPKKSKQANKKYSTGYTTGRIVVDRTKRNARSILKKSKQTCLEKYGVENGSQTKESRDKIYKSRIKQGCTPREERSLRRLYYDAVWKFTEESWKQEFDKINPKRLNRTYNALDHIYSIQQGFRELIPPYIIGHWTNLRVISLSENGIKGMRCDKNQFDLFNDFFACV